MATKKTPTALAAQSSTALVDVRAALAAQVAGLANRTAPPTGAAIKVTQDKKFKFPDGTETPAGGSFKAVILDYTCIREYYPGAYDKDNIEPPACFAINPEPKLLNPSANSPDRQNETCKGCQHDVWGSGANGKGKACKEGRKLAVVPPSGDEDPIWMLKVSPTAITPFDGYVTSVARVFGLPPISVVSEIGFDPNQSYPTVRFGNPEENKHLAKHFARQPEAIEMLKSEPDVSNFGVEKPEPVRPKKTVRR
jgi:hypothetical protein